jgi:hypothetical protein
VSLTEALDLTTPAGRAMAGLLAVFAAFEREIWVSELAPDWPTPGRMVNVSAGLQRRGPRQLRSETCITLVSVNPKSPVGWRSGGHRYGASWPLEPPGVGA